jgi:hypothetical protein
MDDHTTAEMARIQAKLARMTPEQVSDWLIAGLRQVAAERAAENAAYEAMMAELGLEIPTS